MLPLSCCLCSLHFISFGLTRGVRLLMQHVPGRALSRCRNCLVVRAGIANDDMVLCNVDQREVSLIYC